jgi:phospholipid-binding lipoprotein MlaA
LSVRLARWLLFSALALLLPLRGIAAEPGPEPGSVEPEAVVEAAPVVAPIYDDDLGDDFGDEWLLGPDPAERDPAEGFNRGVFRVNEGFFRWVVNPLSTAYAFIVPAPARRAINRVFDNLDQPVIFINDVLQLAPRDAGESLGRFAINTTIGVLGLFDPATPLGLPGHRTDFGQTLAMYRTPSGAYVVIPLLGPSTARDTFGAVIDGLLSPHLWLLGAGSLLMLNTGSQFATYDIERARLDALRETSVDFYAAMRSAYLLDRDAAVEARRRRLAGETEPGESDAAEDDEPTDGEEEPESLGEEDPDPRGEEGSDAPAEAELEPAADPVDPASELAPTASPEMPDPAPASSRPDSRSGD